MLYELEMFLSNLGLDLPNQGMMLVGGAAAVSFFLLMSMFKSHEQVARSPRSRGPLSGLLELLGIR